MDRVSSIQGGLTVGGRSGVGKWPLRTFLGLAGVLIVLLLGLAFLQAAYADRIVVGVRALGVDLGGQTVAEARALLESVGAELGQQPVTLRAVGREWQFAAQELGMQMDTDGMAQQAYTVGHVGNLFQRMFAQGGAFLFGARVGSPLLRFDLRAQEGALRGIAAEIDQASQDAHVALQPRSDGSVAVTLVPEVAGRRLQVADNAERMRVAIARGLPAIVDLSMMVQEPAVTRGSLEPVRARVQRMVEAPAALTFQGRRWTLSRHEIAAAVVFETRAPGAVEPRIDPERLEGALAPIRRETDQPPQNARFEWDGRGLRPIRASQDGLTIDAAALAPQLERGLAAGERTFPLTRTAARAAVTAEDGPRLGIRELIREGRTGFPGSVPEKQHNIRLAASRLNGTVVPPAGLFSFNREVGPTTLDAGFRTGWGITLSQEGARTIPSVAGGICQVATTLFHPVFHAGYAIEQRNPHLYWIQSYGQPPLGMRGLDATVDDQYGLDFQFINTTPDYLLIQARVEGTTLIFGLYGTKPNWDVKIEGPFITNVVPADRAPVRQLESTMPSGRTLQVEAAQDGFDGTLVRTVTSEQENRRLSLRSHYLPSRNVILHGPLPPEEQEKVEPGAEAPRNAPARAPGAQVPDAQAAPRAPAPVSP